MSDRSGASACRCSKTQGAACAEHNLTQPQVATQPPYLLVHDLAQLHAGASRRRVHDLAEHQQLGACLH